MRAIYKICHAAEWAEAEPTGQARSLGLIPIAATVSSTFPPETKWRKQPLGISPVLMTSCL
jgi:hypothetical protein